jgi:hypothetical protein
MASETTHTGLEGELSQAIDELQTALQQASDATSSIRALLPKVGALGHVLDELDAVIRSGRQQIGESGTATSPAYTRPTLVQPSVEQPTPQWAPEASPQQPAAPPNADDRAGDAGVGEARRSGGAHVLPPGVREPGPLDLRTVDDAVSEHPAVRDVALLDYDGRKATLKVWIDGSARPSDVQSTLIARSSQLFAAGIDVTIVALEDVA